LDAIMKLRPDCKPWSPGRLNGYGAQVSEEEQAAFDRMVDRARQHRPPADGQQAAIKRVRRAEVIQVAAGLARMSGSMVSADQFCASNYSAKKRKPGVRC
jgi:hypothetical protein